MVSRELKSSSNRIGQLYPILVDYHGEIIDGEHRFRADKNWRRIRLKHVKTEKEKTIARIIANNVRRSVPQKEKMTLLSKLGDIYLAEGIEPGRIAHVISEEIGMSYRWVAKYLPIRFKDNRQSDRASSAARRAARILEKLLAPPSSNASVKVKNYANTDFVSVIIEKRFYNEFEKESLDLGLSPELSILKALEQHREKMKEAVRFKNNQLQNADAIEKS